MKQVKIFIIALIMTFTLYAGESDETGYKKSPLTIYSGGIGLGVVRSINDELKNESKTFLDLSFINDVYITHRVHMFTDVNWLAPRLNLGVDAGFDFLFIASRFRPFIGAGIGARYFDKSDYDFGSNLGPSVTVRLGMTFDIIPEVQMRLRVPYYVVVNETTDQIVGLDLGILFSKPYRDIKKIMPN